MDNKELIKDLLKELVSEDVIENVIRELVYDRLESLFTYDIERGIQDRVNALIRQEGDSYIKAAIDKVINGKVRTDDGWGSTKEYGSFEDLVRARISNSLKDGWNVERKVREAVDAKIKKLCDQVRKEHVDNMAEQVMERLASQEASNDG